MFLSKLFSIFRRKKKPEQGTESPPSSSSPSGGMAAGTAAGAASTDPASIVSPSEPAQSQAIDSSTPPDQPVADSSDQQDIASQSISETPEESTEVAQAESAPAYAGENSSSDTSAETTETVAPESDSFQSGSTDEPKLPGEDSAEQPSDSFATPEDGSNNQPGNEAGGPNIG